MSRSDNTREKIIKRENMEVLKHEPSMRFIARLLDEINFFGEIAFTSPEELQKKVGMRSTCHSIIRQLERADSRALLAILQTVYNERQNNTLQLETNDDS